MTVEVELLDQIKIFLQKLFWGILRKHQTIEASMSCRNALLLIIRTLDAKLRKLASIALQDPESLHWGPAAASCVSQQFLELFLGVRFDDFPEPGDDLVVFVVETLVDRIELPILHIDLLQPIKNHLKFRNIECFQKPLVDQMVEIHHKSVQKALLWLVAEPVDAIYWYNGKKRGNL